MAPMRKTWGIALGALSMALSFAPQSALAQTPIAVTAVRQFDAADFAAAAASFQQVVETSGATRRDVVEAFTYLAVIRSGFGDNEVAERFASFALAVDPTAAPPVSAPPTVRGMFDRLRGTVDPIQVTLAIEPTNPEEPPTVRSHVRGSVALLDATLRLDCATPGQGTIASHSARARTGDTQLVLEALLPGSHARCTATISTAAGTALAEATPQTVARLVALPGWARSRRRIPTWGYIAGGTGVGVLLTIGVIIGVTIATSAQPDTYRFGTASVISP